MRKLFITMVLALLTISASLKAQDESLVLHYDFRSVDGTTVHSASGGGPDATLKNNARVETMGEYNVLSLGTANGYLDMTPAAGDLLKASDNYTISAYYCVDDNASLDGNGYFLWAFSTASACTQTEGKYSAYRLNAQRIATSTGGYGSETGFSVGNASAKGRWIHVAYTENATTGRLYIDGELKATISAMPRNSTNYGNATIQYCWLGRAPFSGDSYLKSTLVADFRLYNRTLEATEVSKLAGETRGLEYAYEHSPEGDNSKLLAAIAEAEALVNGSEAGMYMPGALADLQDALLMAGNIAAGGYSQTVIDRHVAMLTDAMSVVRATTGMTFDMGSLEAAYDTNRGFIHPGGLHTQADFDRIKAQIAAGNEKVVSAYNILKNAEYAQPTIQTYPVETIIRGGTTGQNYINAARGATMAYQNALRWKIEGNTSCAAAGVRILKAWANTCKLVSGDSNWALAAGLYGYEFAQAAELLRDYDGWGNNGFENFKKWMLTVWYPGCIHFLRGRNGTWENVGNQGGIRPGHYWSNWPLCNALAVISIGILCDDVFIYNQGMSFLKYDQVGTFRDPRTDDLILNDGCTEFWGNLIVTTSESELETGAYGKLGQMQESGRDGGHAAMALGLAVDIAHVAWNQGDDLFSYMDNRLAAGIEFTAACTQNETGLPWTNYKYVDCRTAWHNGWLMTAPAEPAEVRNYWGTVIGHYEGVKGVKMPYAEKAYQQMGIDAGGMGGTSGGYDHLGYSVLMNTYDGIAPADKVPTLLTPRMEYDGQTIDHNELGGLKNNYAVDTNKALPRGKTVRLMPQLPEGEEDTGNWKWNTGETTKDITITTDRSYAYRATYTNKNGIESQQVFTIAVDGDCVPSQSATPYIIYNGETISTDTLTVFYGETVTLGIWGTGGYESYQWDNGSNGTTLVTRPLVRARDFAGAYINQGGARSVCKFHIDIQNMRIQTIVNGHVMVDTVDVTVNKGDQVVFGPYVPDALPGCSYKWSSGQTTRTVLIDSAAVSGTYTLDYTVNGERGQIVYTLLVNDDKDCAIANGEYMIYDRYNDTYLTANGNNLSCTMSQKASGEDIGTQVWNLENDGSNYYNIVNSDTLFLTLAAKTTTTTGRYPFAFRQALGSDYYELHNKYPYYWLFGSDGKISVSKSKQPTTYPLMLIPYNANAISNPTIQDGGATAIYNIMGQKLSQPVKGLNIINGKKVMVRAR